MSDKTTPSLPTSTTYLDIPELKEFLDQIPEDWAQTDASLSPDDLHHPQQYILDSARRLKEIISTYHERHFGLISLNQVQLTIKKSSDKLDDVRQTIDAIQSFSDSCQDVPTQLISALFMSYADSYFNDSLATQQLTSHSNDPEYAEVRYALETLTVSFAGIEREFDRLMIGCEDGEFSNTDAPAKIEDPLPHQKKSHFSPHTLTLKTAMGSAYPKDYLGYPAQYFYNHTSLGYRYDFTTDQPKLKWISNSGPTLNLNILSLRGSDKNLGSHTTSVSTTVGWHQGITPYAFIEGWAGLGVSDNHLNFGSGTILPNETSLNLDTGGRAGLCYEFKNGIGLELFAETDFQKTVFGNPQYQSTQFGGGLGLYFNLPQKESD